MIDTRSLRQAQEMSAIASSAKRFEVASFALATISHYHNVRDHDAGEGKPQGLTGTEDAIMRAAEVRLLAFFNAESE